MTAKGLKKCGTKPETGKTKSGTILDIDEREIAVDVGNHTVGSSQRDGRTNQWVARSVGHSTCNGLLREGENTKQAQA